MTKAVVIIGAGASAPFGVPTLLRVFQDIYARQYLKKDNFLYENLNNIFWEPRGHNLDNSNLGLSVEEILTIVRDFETKPYGVSPIISDTERFKRSLYVLIKKAIYDGKHSRGQYLNPIINFMRKQYQNVTWSSFNWDCIFEASYYYSSADYPWSRSNPRIVVNLNNWRNTSSNHTFLKLHGGINWWYENESLLYLPFGSQTDLNQRWDLYEKGEAGGHPVILEPSYYKYEDPIYKLIKGQWEVFVNSLLEADLILVIGYSLPEADLEARRALTIGFQGNTKAKFIIIDNSENVCHRFERLFGTSRLKTIRQSLEDVYQQLPQMILEIIGGNS